MGPRSRKRSNLPRLAWALGLAACAHLLTLLLLGWRIPAAPSPPPGDSLPPVEVRLLPPLRSAAPAALSAAPAKPNPARPARPETPAPAPPAAVSAPPSPQAAQGAPDCAPEDLPLLTDAEKARCRNQIDADTARSLARGADERAAKAFAETKRGAQIFRADDDRQAYYDKLTQAEAKANGVGSVAKHSVGPGVGCSNMTFPLLSGADINPDLFEKKHMQEHKPNYGHANCSAHF